MQSVNKYTGRVEVAGNAVFVERTAPAAHRREEEVIVLLSPMAASSQAYQDCLECIQVMGFAWCHRF